MTVVETPRDGTTKPLIKVCGLTKPQDATLAAILGADMCGFIFHPESPRYLYPAAARVMATPGAKRVGVFVKEGLEATLAIMEEAVLDFAQLHGEQDLALAQALGPNRVIKVFWPERESPPELARLMELWRESCAYFLFDSGRGGGGSGRRLQEFVLASPKPYLLAGGLTPEVVRAIWPSPDPKLVGFDLNSGVESAPGQKNPEALKALLPWIQ